MGGSLCCCLHRRKAEGDGATRRGPKEAGRRGHRYEQLQQTADDICGDGGDVLSESPFAALQRIRELDFDASDPPVRTMRAPFASEALGAPTEPERFSQNAALPACVQVGIVGIEQAARERGAEANADVKPDTFPSKMEDLSEQIEQCERNAGELVWCKSPLNFSSNRRARYHLILAL
eukprot:SAG11_NODE_2703_length_3074_cov_3.917983_1_plen_178_part_00